MIIVHQGCICSSVAVLQEQDNKLDDIMSIGYKYLDSNC